MRFLALGVVMLAVAASGCGTACNLAGGVIHPDGEPRVYGGVIRDVEVIDSAVSSPQPVLDMSGFKGEGGAYFVAAILSIAAIDPVLCLAADTVTLPITIPLQNRRIAREKENHDADSPVLGPASEPPEGSNSGGS